MSVYPSLHKSPQQYTILVANHITTIQAINSMWRKVALLGTEPSTSKGVRISGHANTALSDD